MRDTHREREAETQAEKPDVGLDPRTLGSHPELKVDAQPLSHPGAPRAFLFLSGAPNCPVVLSSQPWGPPLHVSVSSHVFWEDAPCPP